MIHVAPLDSFIPKHSLVQLREKIGRSPLTCLRLEQARDVLGGDEDELPDWVERGGECDL